MLRPGGGVYESTLATMAFETVAWGFGEPLEMISETTLGLGLTAATDVLLMVPATWSG
jgi:hypothetical protein